MGVPLAIVGKTLGHQNLATTQRHYVRVDEVTLDDVRRRMNDFNASIRVLRSL
jgi:site-specific recombinase XerD